jgi:hypothetical protein
MIAHNAYMLTLTKGIKKIDRRKWMPLQGDEAQKSPKKAIKITNKESKALDNIFNNIK